jgi:hypothetical protein
MKSVVRVNFRIESFLAKLFLDALELWVQRSVQSPLKEGESRSY